MPTGSLKTWVKEKGFGFICPDTGPPDVFAHARQLQNFDSNNLNTGMKCQFETEMDLSKGKPKVSSWSIIEDGAGGGGMPQMGGMPQPNFGAPQFGGMPPMQGGYGPVPGQPQQLGGMPGSAPYSGAPQPGVLPPGWETATDPSTGKMYFFNRSTNETRWDPPPAPAPAPCPMQPAGGAPALPPGWESAQDPSTGKTYFFNRSTNETRWDFPTPVAAAPPAAAPAPGLPPGWEQANDPGSGKTYYFNRSTNETRWDRPA